MDLSKVFKGVVLSTAAAATFQALGAEAAEAGKSNSVLDMINAVNQSIFTDIVHDPIRDPIADLIYQDEDDNTVKNPAFVEGSRNYSEDGFVPVASKRFSNMQSFDLTAMYKMCQDRPDECPQPDTTFSVFLSNTPELLATVNRVNDQINALPPVSDKDNYGVDDYWHPIDEKGGDCEDYALRKREELIKAGIPEGALRLVSVLTPAGEAHEVLGLSTIRGTLFLDNYEKGLTMASQSDYEVVATTSPQEPWKISGMEDAFHDDLGAAIEKLNDEFYAPIRDNPVADSNIPPPPRKRPDGPAP